MLGHDRIQAVIPERGSAAAGLVTKPVMLEGHLRQRITDLAETVQIGLAALAPVDELDPQLEGSTGLGEEFILVDAQRLVEDLDLGNGRLADAHSADAVGFHETDPREIAVIFRQGGSGHPARSSTSKNYDIEPLVRHPDNLLNT